MLEYNTLCQLYCTTGRHNAYVSAAFIHLPMASATIKMNIQFTIHIYDIHIIDRYLLVQTGA